MKKQFVVSIVLLVTTLSGVKASECPPEVLSVIKNQKHGSLLVCLDSTGLTDKKEDEVFIIQNFEERDASDLAGVTVSIYDKSKFKTKTEKSKKNRVAPFYQESGLGLTLLPFTHDGREVRYLVEDIDGDGTTEWVIFSQSQPKQTLFIKSFNRDQKRFNYVGYKAKNGKHHDFFVAEPGEKFDISREGITVRIGDRIIRRYDLKNGKFVETNLTEVST